MKRFLQLIIGALVVGMLCLTLSHWFKSKEQVHTNQKNLRIQLGRIYRSRVN